MSGLVGTTSLNATEGKHNTGRRKDVEKEKTAGPEQQQLIVHPKIFGQFTDRSSVVPSLFGKADSG